jgi:hypothetical protein
MPYGISSGSKVERAYDRSGFLSIIRSGIEIVTRADINRGYIKETTNANVDELILRLTITPRAHEDSLAKAKRVKAPRDNQREHPEVTGRSMEQGVSPG